MHFSTTLLFLSAAISLPCRTKYFFFFFFFNDYRPTNNNFINNTCLTNFDANELLFINTRCKLHILHIQRADTNHITLLNLYTYHDDTVAIILTVMDPFHGTPISETHGTD
ncbi:uncharacterized protein BHQ10_000796 [Talaromyces amestolkiae]|uniref:Secreted protein n=1 Tax=Talaromyces amestolkiae TaxID=1196081 RepID=A0A364KMK8_TALAM|nr:uncharacterized protein BHQ10_000796 [Talaromyces amestolkiae]RAO64784.1 hypothetical protein BHQ10_000796 [Talaromyces amestolkiae]